MPSWTATDVVVSFTNWDRSDLSEVRANTFAGPFLMPPEFRSIPEADKWSNNKALDWANRLRVSTRRAGDRPERCGSH